MTSGLQPPNIASTSSSQVMTNSFVTANWTDGLQFLLNPPLFVGYGSALQGIATGGSGTAVLIDTEVADTYNGHSTISLTSRYVGQVPGWYRVSGSISFAGNALGGRKGWISLNGVEVPYSNVQGAPSLSSADATSLSIPSTLVYMNGTGDYVELYALQTSGSTVNLNPNSTNVSGISIVFEHM